MLLSAHLEWTHSSMLPCQAGHISCPLLSAMPQSNSERQLSLIAAEEFRHGGGAVELCHGVSWEDVVKDVS